MPACIPRDSFVSLQDVGCFPFNDWTNHTKGGGVEVCFWVREPWKSVSG